MSGVDATVALTLAIAALGIAITVIGVVVASLFRSRWALGLYAVGSLLVLWFVLFTMKGRRATIGSVQRLTRREIRSGTGALDAARPRSSV